MVDGSNTRIATTSELCLAFLCLAIALTVYLVAVEVTRRRRGQPVRVSLVIAVILMLVAAICCAMYFPWVRMPDSLSGVWHLG